MPAHQVLQFVSGLAHLDAERLCLGRARDRAAVVVAQHHQRDAAKARLEHALAAGVEVVAVNEPEHGRSGV